MLGQGLGSWVEGPHLGTEGAISSWNRKFHGSGDQGQAWLSQGAAQETEAGVSRWERPWCCSTHPSQPRASRLISSPTKLPGLTPNPSQLCKLLPSLKQSFGCSPRFGANQGLHPKDSARTLILLKKPIHKQQKKLCQGLLLKFASSQNPVQTFQGSGDANANVSFKGQKDKISTYSSSGWFLSCIQLCWMNPRRFLMWKRIMWLVSGSLQG